MKVEKEYNGMRYLEYIPDKQKGEKLPLLIYLHGAGERGDDLGKVVVHGPLKEIVAGNIRDDFMIISPQCEMDKTWWDYSERLYVLVKSYIKNPFVDSSKVYLTGNSMGGYGTWAFAMAHPEMFAAIIPICGGGMPWNAFMLQELPVWAFHCIGDEVVSYTATLDMVRPLQFGTKKEVKFTVYPGCSHDAWTETYKNQEVYDWLLQYSKAEREGI